MIVNPGNYQHHHESDHANQRLPCKVIQIIAEISLRFIRTCTVQHDKPEAHEEYDDEQHVIIKILYLCRRFSPQSDNQAAEIAAPGPCRPCRCAVLSPHRSLYYFSSSLHRSLIPLIACTDIAGSPTVPHRAHRLGITQVS